MNEFPGADLDIQLEDPDLENEMLEELALEEAKDFTRTLLDAFPKWRVSPEAKASYKERLHRYTTLTHPMDVANLKNTKYLDELGDAEEAVEADPWDVRAAARLAELTLVSPFWRNYLAIPEYFKVAQADYIDVMKRAERDNGRS